MTYRSDEDALSNRKGVLDGELNRVRQQLDELRDLRREEARLQAELAEARTQQARASERKHLPMLESMRIPIRCKEDWEKMRGNDQIRHCFKCNKNVYNLSAMTAEEAEALLETRRQIDTCVRFFVRPDGTMVTADCTRKKRNIMILAGAAAAAAAVAGVGAAQLSSHDSAAALADVVVPTETFQNVEDYEDVTGGISWEDEPVVEMGEVAVEPPPPPPPAARTPQRKNREYKGGVSYHGQAADPIDFAKPLEPNK
jgi:hypothetical protein